MVDRSIFFFTFHDRNVKDSPVFHFDIQGVIVAIDALDVRDASDIEKDEVADFFCNINFCVFHYNIDIRGWSWTGQSSSASSCSMTSFDSSMS